MKKLTLILSILCFTVLSGSTYAQDEEIPKELLLSSLNSVGRLKLENDQLTQLMDYNKGFVDKVYGILESDKEEKYKKESLKALAYTRETDLHAIIGKHQTNKYLKLMEDELKPLVKKNHLLRQIAKS